MPARKQNKKQQPESLRISNFALLLVVFKRHHGSEGVKPIILLSVMFNVTLPKLIISILFRGPVQNSSCKVPGVRPSGRGKLTERGDVRLVVEDQ